MGFSTVGASHKIKAFFGTEVTAEMHDRPFVFARGTNHLIQLFFNFGIILNEIAGQGTYHKTVVAGLAFRDIDATFFPAVTLNF